MDNKVKSTNDFAPKYCPHCAAEYPKPQVSVFDSQCATEVREDAESDAHEILLTFTSRQSCASCKAFVAIQSVLHIPIDDFYESSEKEIDDDR